MKTPVIQTRRLKLRPFHESDAKPLNRILAVEGVLRYFPSTNPPTLGQTQRFVRAQINHWKEHGFGWWAVELRDKPQIIGWNGLQYLPDTDEIEIGFLLDKTCWGKGYATEGGRPGLAFGFKQLALDEIIAVVHPENIASQKVIQKLGLKFTEETEYFGMAVYRYALAVETYRAQQSSARV